MTGRLSSVSEEVGDNLYKVPMARNKLGLRNGKEVTTESIREQEEGMR